MSAKKGRPGAGRTIVSRGRQVGGFLLFSAALLVYIWPRNLLVTQGYRQQEAEMAYRELLSENDWLEARLLLMKNASEVRARMAAFDIRLVEPEQWNVYYLDPPGAPPLPAAENDPGPDPGAGAP